MFSISAHPDTFKYAFTEAIFSLQTLEIEAIAFIHDRLRLHRKEHNTILLPFGAICDRLYFLHSGLARGYYVENEKEITTSTVAAKIEMRLRRKGWTGIWVNHNTTSYSVGGTWGFTHNLDSYWSGLPSSPHGPNTITLGSGFDGHTSNPKYYFYYNQQYNLNTALGLTFDMMGTQKFSSLDCSCTNSF